jgi:hypothetical protein
MTASGAAMLHGAPAGRTAVAEPASSAPASTAFIGGAASATVRAGDRVVVPVTLDLGVAGASGDVGSVELELRYPASLLTYEAATHGLKGASEAHLVAPGRLRFAFAGTSAQGSARLTLVTVAFRVDPAARAGTEGQLSLVYTSPPTSTAFATYEMPVPQGGRLRVVSR